MINENGLMEKEQMALDCLTYAYNHFSELESTHPNDLSDFADAIHLAQRIIGMRCLRRDYPNLWITKTKKEEGK